MSGELSPASVYVSLLPVVEACVVVAVPGRVGEVRVPADEPEAVDLDPGVLACRLDAPATVKAVLEQGRVLLRNLRERKEREKVKLIILKRVLSRHLRTEKTRLRREAFWRLAPRIRLRGHPKFDRVAWATLRASPALLGPSGAVRAALRGG